MTFIRLIAAAAILSVAGIAPSAHAHGLEVEARWAHGVATVGNTGAVYLRIANDAYHPEYLYRASTPVAARVELHRTGPAGNMRPVDRLEIPFDSTVDMRQSGYHLMLVGLKRPVKPGDVIPLELTFSDDQVQQTNVTVPRRK